MPNTLNLTDQTSIIILGKLYNNDTQVQLFLLNSLAALGSDDSINDSYVSTSPASVQVVSMDGKVTIENVTDGGPAWNLSAVYANGLKLSYASTSLTVPAEGTPPVQDEFNILVHGIKADPTVIISRGGTGDFALGTRSRPG
jgi:hypothetical protein